jgi:hypothetical protein
LEARNDEKRGIRYVDGERELSRHADATSLSSLSSELEADVVADDDELYDVMDDEHDAVERDVRCA